MNALNLDIHQDLQGLTRLPYDFHQFSQYFHRNSFSTWLPNDSLASKRRRTFFRGHLRPPACHHRWTFAKTITKELNCWPQRASTASQQPLNSLSTAFGPCRYVLLMLPCNLYWMWTTNLQMTVQNVQILSLPGKRSICEGSTGNSGMTRQPIAQIFPPTESPPAGRRRRCSVIAPRINAQSNAMMRMMVVMVVMVVMNQMSDGPSFSGVLKWPKIHVARNNTHE